MTTNGRFFLMILSVSAIQVACNQGTSSYTNQIQALNAQVVQLEACARYPGTAGCPSVANGGPLGTTAYVLPTTGYPLGINGTTPYAAYPYGTQPTTVGGVLPVTLPAQSTGGIIAAPKGKASADPVAAKAAEVQAALKALPPNPEDSFEDIPPRVAADEAPTTIGATIRETAQAAPSLAQRGHGGTQHIDQSASHPEVSRAPSAAIPSAPRIAETPPERTGSGGAASSAAQ